MEFIQKNLEVSIKLNVSRQAFLLGRYTVHCILAIGHKSSKKTL